jgi:hypothetical protein
LDQINSNSVLKFKFQFKFRAAQLSAAHSLPRSLHQDPTCQLQSPLSAGLVCCFGQPVGPFFKMPSKFSLLTQLPPLWFAASSPTCATRGSPFLFPPSRASFLCSRNYRALLNHDDHCHHHISTQTPPSNECVLTTAPPSPMSISLAETSQATRISIFPCRHNILGECHPLATSF